MKKLVIATIAACCVFAAALAQGGSNSLPDLVLKDTKGANVNVSDYGKSGKITVVSFWATWCSPCIKELRNVNELLPDWEKEYNVQLVAVSLDNTKTSLKVKPFADGQGWSFPILLDVNEDLKRALNVTNPPVTFLLNTEGKIVYTHTGYLEGDEYELEKQIKLVAGK